MNNVPNKGARWRAAGYTLTEMTIVISILAIAAAVAMPSFSASNDKKLDVAAQAFAAAMRFARSESILTDVPHGFRQESSDNRIRVFRLDTGTTPATPVFDVYHPVDKQIYDIDLDLQPLAAADSMSLSTIFRGVCNQTGDIYFDSNGTPWCVDPETILLESLDLDLYLGSSHRLIVLDGLTGRVNVQ